MSLATKKSTKKRHVDLPSARREPAGAESLFGMAKSMRSHLPGISGIPRADRLDRRRSSWILRQLLRRRNQPGFHPGLKESTNLDQLLLLEEGVDALDVGCQEISLPSCFFGSQEEKKRLAEMKFHLEQDLHGLKKKTVRLANKKVVPVGAAFPDVYGDLRLLRFLRKDKQQDPVSASIRYQRFLHWREENNVDEIRAQVEKQPFHPPSNLVADYIPCEFDLTETVLEGSSNLPIVLNVGKWKTAEISKLIHQKKLSLEDFLRYWIYMFESLHRQLYLESYRLQKMIYVDEICDLSGMRMQQFSPGFVSQVLKPWLSVTQTYYPETTRRISFLDPPRVLALVWKIVAPLASPGTVAKVRLFSGFDGSVHDFVHVRRSEQTKK
jgi:hypothetical protein